jgi:ferric-dicitrate binding protein FerR (iron transport regulator)
VGARLSEELDRRAARGFRSWWATLFAPRWVAAGALAVGLAVVAAALFSRAPAPSSPPIAAPSAPEHIPAPPPEPPAEPVKKTLTVQVASAKKAQADRAQAKRAQVLSQGAVVATEQGGSLWMTLPDGSRAGLTGQSEVALSTLEATRLALDVTRGSLALVVPHRDDRVLVVRAGEVEVKDLGTRFLVSRSDNRVLVAVEEGRVEVKTPTATQTVSAGRAVSWRDGQLLSLPWARSEPPPTAAPAAGGTAAKLSEEDDEEPEAEEPKTEEPAEVERPRDTTPEAEWALPEQLTSPGAPPAPAPALAPTPDEPPPVRAPPPPRHRGFNLAELERRLREFGRTVQAPFSLSPQQRQRQAKDVTHLADGGDCEGSLALAEAWLQDSERARDPAPLRRGVLLQKVRCLNRLGRTAEAQAVQRELNAP